jgi:microcin C transport system ATP-binding protein
MQVVFQDPNSSLNPRLTAQQIIEEGLRVHQPTLTAAEREQAVILAMQEVGLDPASRQRYPAVLRRPAPAYRHRQGADRQTAADRPG